MGAKMPTEPTGQKPPPPPSPPPKGRSAPAHKNWRQGCTVCGSKPTVGDVGLCGPCCFGEADTVGGNW